jgi:hypothetical protein
MTENMPGTHGWRNAGPAGRSAEPRTAGPVRVTNPRTEKVTILAPYTESEVQAIVKRSRECPRHLSIEESRLAQKNRRADLEQRRALERWAAANLGTRQARHVSDRRHADMGAPLSRATIRHGRLVAPGT